jgi:hypothetical protein
VLVGVIAVCLAIVANNARRQKRAVEIIRGLGGSVQYDFEQEDEPSQIADWLRSTVGDDFVSHIVDAHLPRRAIVTDDVLAAIAGLRGLERLSLSETTVTDDGIAALKHLRRLRILMLNRTCVGDEGLAALSGLTRLLWLELNETNVTDAGLLNLRGMSEL